MLSFALSSLPPIASFSFSHRKTEILFPSFSKQGKKTIHSKIPTSKCEYVTKAIFFCKNSSISHGMHQDNNISHGVCHWL
ncbi:Uncharacterized protein TCM_008880 [Theobroma cacao]|uniref:Uncharacterized protein n=1 Tax=Theobroma cacao TaxID=3641 RepID=A0A061E4J1_THECC|nr:Uncharacterized protein TCM_008880 [Theobroma cacao]